MSLTSIGQYCFSIPTETDSHLSPGSALSASGFSGCNAEAGKTLLRASCSNTVASTGSAVVSSCISGSTEVGKMLLVVSCSSTSSSTVSSSTAFSSNACADGFNIDFVTSGSLSPSSRGCPDSSGNTCCLASSDCDRGAAPTDTSFGTLSWGLPAFCAADGNPCFELASVGASGIASSAGGGRYAASLEAWGALSGAASGTAVANVTSVFSLLGSPAGSSIVEDLGNIAS
mmetsp:Transcript_41015/g.80974  ORF Transcript_41015/g.80974 Transcript_41015/m.80974 type:complete len:230 (+) Transcript_41015:68-757(+)